MRSVCSRASTTSAGKSASSSGSSGKSGALWVVGRAVNPQLRDTDETRPDDVIFEGYELGDALEHGNDALEDDVRVLEQDGRDAYARPFTRKEVLPLLERWFFNR